MIEVTRKKKKESSLACCIGPPGHPQATGTTLVWTVRSQPFALFPFCFPHTKLTLAASHAWAMMCLSHMPQDNRPNSHGLEFKKKTQPKQSLSLCKSRTFTVQSLSVGGYSGTLDVARSAVTKDRAGSQSREPGPQMSSPQASQEGQTCLMVLRLNIQVS